MLHRVGRYAEAIARELGLDDATVDRVRLAGMLHDVGKIGVEASILREGPLGPDEMAEVRRHAEVGSRIVRNAGFDEIADWIAAHHERPDGSGYPAGLDGDRVPLGARILAVADAYDAMTSDRSYRSAMTSSEARRELLAGAGEPVLPRGRRRLHRLARAARRQAPCEDQGGVRRRRSGRRTQAGEAPASRPAR